MRPSRPWAVMLAFVLLSAPASFAQDPSPTDNPVFVARDVEPSLSNTAEIVELLRRVYPPCYRDTGLDVTAVLWVRVGTDGAVEASQVLESTGYDAFDQAAVQVADAMVFSPALLEEEPVAVWVHQAIRFKSSDSGWVVAGPAQVGEEDLDKP